MKKALILMIASIATTMAMASAVDWEIRFDTSGEMMSKWGNATAYAYTLVAPLTSGVSSAMTPQDFMANWSSDIATSDSVYAARPVELGVDDQYSGSVTGEYMTKTPVPDVAGYLIIVLVNAEGEAIYSYVDGTGNMLGLSTRDDMSPAGANGSYAFTDESEWTVVGDVPVDPGVPEPTVLALLALGVAGVALRRRVA